MAAYTPSVPVRWLSRPRAREGEQVRRITTARVDIPARVFVRLALVAFALATGVGCAAISSAQARPRLANPAAACAPGPLVTYAHALVVTHQEWICGDVDAYGGDITVLGRVTGNVTAFGGTLKVAGLVEGNVTAFGGDIWLLPGARVTGDVRTWGGTIHRNSEVLVAGDIEHGDRLTNFVGSRLPGFSGQWAFPWPWMLAWAVLAAIVVTLAPERTLRVSAVARRAAWRSLAVGALTVVLGATLAAVMFATCVGIPLSLLLLGALLVAWVLGTAALGVWLGDHVIRAIAPNEHSPLLAAVVGAALLAGFETLPWIGGVVSIVAGSIALGAALLGRFGAQGPPGQHALAAPPDQ